MTARMAAAIKKKRPLALLAAIEHPDGPGYFWTGIGKLVWNGNTFTGSGQLGTVTPISHTSDLTIQDVQFTMVGVDPNVVAGLNDNVRNLSGKVWLACIEQVKVVADPYLIVDSVLDYQSFNAAEDGTVSLSITAHTGFYTLARALNETWTTEQQKIDFPGDSGLDLISGLQNQDIQWTPS